MRELNDQRTLEDIVEYLYENQDEVFISENKTSALLYYPPNDAVIFIIGDFRGGEREINREIRRLVPRMN